MINDEIAWDLTSEMPLNVTAFGQRDDAVFLLGCQMKSDILIIQPVSDGLMTTTRSASLFLHFPPNFYSAHRTETRDRCRKLHPTAKKSIIYRDSTRKREHLRLGNQYSVRDREILRINFGARLATIVSGGESIASKCR